MRLDNLIKKAMAPVPDPLTNSPIPLTLRKRIPFSALMGYMSSMSAQKQH